MRIRDAARVVVKYVGDVMGDNDYQRYVEHRRRTHPDGEVLSEREYWRLRHDESTPTIRCC